MPTQQQLKDNLMNVLRYNKLTGTIPILGFDAPITFDYLAYLSGLADQATREDPTAIRAIFDFSGQDTVLVTNEDFLVIYFTLAAHIQHIFDAEAAVIELIENNTITDYGPLSTAFDNAIADPPISRPSLGNDVYSMINGITDIEGGLETWASGVNSSLGGKFNTPSGTTSQYIRGDGSLATFPSIATLPIAISNVTGLQTALDGKASTSHTHATSDVVSGTFADARIAQSNVTQHQASLSIATSQITGTKTSSFISDFTTAVRALFSASNGVSYNSSTGAITGTTPTVNNNVSRTLNSNYTISSNVRGVICNYSINASWTLNALLSGSGAAFLEYSVDNGSNWITVNNVGKGLNLLTFAGSDDMNLSGFIPATATNTRIRTTATNMTVTYTRGQEVLI